MKTAVGTDPKPSPDEMLKSFEKLTVTELLYIISKLEALIKKRAQEDMKEDYKYE